MKNKGSAGKVRHKGVFTFYAFLLERNANSSMTDSPLVIDIEEILEVEGLHLSFDDVGSYCTSDADFPKDVRLQGGLSGKADFYRQGNNIHLSGKINGVLLLSCHRCLADCTEKVDRDFYYMLQAAENDLSLGMREISLGEDDLDVWNFVEGVIRLDEIFREQLLLQVPQKVLCSSECRGLCPHCGTDLNTGRCSCSEIVQSSPFAVLQSLKV